MSEQEQGASDSADTRPENDQRTPVKKLPVPTETLPTERIKPESQFAILRGYAAAAGPEGRIVSNGEVAKITNNAASTISICNKFWSEIGLLTKGSGGYSPSEYVQAYSQSYTWKADGAERKLAPAIRETWFFKALEPMLRFRTVATEEAIHTLAERANAHPDYRAKLEFLIEVMATTGVIVIQNGAVQRANNSSVDDVPASHVEKGAPAMSVNMDPAASSQMYRKEETERVNVPPGAQSLNVPADFIIYKCKISGGRVLEIPLPPKFLSADAARLFQFLKTQVDDEGANGDGE